MMPKKLVEIARRVAKVMMVVVGLFKAVARPAQLLDDIVGSALSLPRMFTP